MDASHRVRIDLANRTLDAEGDEQFVRSMVNAFVELANVGTSETTGTSVASSQEAGPLQPPPPAGLNGPRAVPKSSKPRPKDSYEIVRDLDLMPKDGKETLDQFFAKKSPQNAFEKNTVFVYYLTVVLGLGGISVNHVFTCYRHLRTQMPEKLRQSLWDTGSKKGWLDTRDIGNLSVPIAGLNLVEQMLPRATKPSA